MSDLFEVAAAMVARGKGILAADESIATMSKRLQAAGVAADSRTRRDYRELLLTAPGLSTSVSGIIFCDETLGQELSDGTPFPLAAHRLGILPGIKVDTGTVEMPFATGGLITQGLDGLRERLAGYREQGAVFAKWRAVVGPIGVSNRVLQANAHALARYAALCQEAGIVPIVEPEFLMDGDHGIALTQAVTANTLKAVFQALDLMGVDPRGLVLKPNMVVPGNRHQEQGEPIEIARRTLAVLSARVPPTVPGIAFLSGGQSNEEACRNLRAINEQAAEPGNAPWRLTFSFGRALVNDALRIWAGQPGSVAAAQQALVDNCRRASGAADVLTAWYPRTVAAK
jgi:fructose-bisphosphate aldolase class I